MVLSDECTTTTNRTENSLDGGTSPSLPSPAEPARTSLPHGAGALAPTSCRRDFSSERSRRCALAILGAALGLGTASAVVHASAPASEDAHGTTVRWLLDPALTELAGLESAVRSHVATIDATLDVVDTNVPTTIERAWVEALRDRAREDAVRAVFWVRRTDPAGVQLYLLDVASGRVYVRRVDVPLDAGPTALEVLGLLVKSTTAELVDGMPVGMDPVELAPAVAIEPEPRKPVPAAPRPLGELRIAAGYVGTSYAQTARWRSGGGLWLGWAFPFGLELALGTTPMQWTRASHDTSEIVVRRNPFELVVGYGGRLGRVVLAGDLAFVVDRSVRLASTSDPSLAAEPKRGWWLFAIAPRLRVDVRVVRWFGVFAALGVEFWINNVEYGVSAPTPAVLVSPRRIRPWVTIGPVFRIPMRARDGAASPHSRRRGQ